MSLSIRTSKLAVSALKSLLILASLAQISAAADTSGTVNLAWDPNPESDIAGYRVHYGTTSGNFPRSLEVNAAPGATLAGLESGTTYYCVVQAFNSSGVDSLYSSEIAFAIPAIPQPEPSVEHASGSALTTTNAGPAGIDFGMVDLGTPGLTKTFILKNPGTADLTGLAITADGANFLVTALGTTTLAPGETTVFNVNFKPSAAGSHATVIHISSNEARALDISLTGLGVAVSKFAIEHPLGFELSASESTIRFGDSLPGTTSAAETFTLRNTGTAALTGLTVAASGVDSADFILGTPDEPSLAPGASTTFQIAFKPTATGIRSAILHVSSNEAGENTLKITLLGHGIGGPEIAVQDAAGIHLDDATGAQDFGGLLVTTPGDPRTYTIHNTGTADLTGLAVSTGGADAADFITSSLEVTSLAPGTSTTFRIAFQPSAAGIRTATVHIASNDADESLTDITLTGSGIAVPILALENADGILVAPAGAVVPFGDVNVGSTGDPVTLVVSNTGAGLLTGLRVTIAGVQDPSFVLELPPVTSLEPGATTRFSVRFKPTSGGLHTATVRVASASPLQIPFEIGLNGNGITVPEIAILQDNGADLTGGSASVSFGNCNLGSTSPAHTFTVRNSGSAPLTNLSVASDDPEFVTGHFDTTTLAPGASTTFQVSFQPSIAGTRGANLSIVSNDINESPFLITLTGNGISAPEISAPEISVHRNGRKFLKDEASIINFGTVEVGTTGKGIVFTIRNTGTANLDNLALTKDGINPSDFMVSALRTTSLAPGSSTTFKINFIPTNAGTRWAAIHIASNDQNEQSFDIVLTGSGAARPSTLLLSAPARIGNNPGIPASPVRGIEVIGGRKYRTLTLTKTAGTTLLPRNVEVSSNLVDWSSGKTHTTVLIDNATTLKVRDNTPVTRDAKRHIRLKPIGR